MNAILKHNRTQRYQIPPPALRTHPQALPNASSKHENAYRLVVSFYDIDEHPQVAVPLRSPDNLVEVRHIYDTHAWSVSWKPQSTAGNATGFLESILGVPATTRTAGTLERLARKHGAGDT